MNDVVPRIGKVRQLMFTFYWDLGGNLWIECPFRVFLENFGEMKQVIAWQGPRHVGAHSQGLHASAP